MGCFRCIGRVCRFFFACALPLWWNGTSVPAQNRTPELHVAAAADLQPVLSSLVAPFERQSGTHIVATFGSSATLTQQIENGSPMDVFLSADCTHPQQLADAHRAAPEGPVPYATGVLVLWARKDSPAQPLTLGSLTSPKVTRLAVANSEHAPYGQAAAAALRAMGLVPTLDPKLVTGENIMQTAQFADTGNAQAALISLTIASSPHFRETGSYVVLPRNYPAIRQCAVALRGGSDPTRAVSFVHWLTSPAVQGHLPALGLEPAH